MGITTGLNEKARLEAAPPQIFDNWLRVVPFELTVGEQSIEVAGAPTSVFVINGVDNGRNITALVDKGGRGIRSTKTRTADATIALERRG